MTPLSKSSHMSPLTLALRFLRSWWLVILFSIACGFVSDRILRLERDGAAAQRDLSRCNAQLHEYQEQTVRELGAAIDAWADAGADRHVRAERDMERLMNNGF